MGDTRKPSQSDKKGRSRIVIDASTATMNYATTAYTRETRSTYYTTYTHSQTISPAFSMTASTASATATARTSIPSRLGLNTKTLSSHHVTDSKIYLNHHLSATANPIVQTFSNSHVLIKWLHSIDLRPGGCPNFPSPTTSPSCPDRSSDVTTRIQQFISSKKAAPDGQYICKWDYSGENIPQPTVDSIHNFSSKTQVLPCHVNNCEATGIYVE